MYAQVKGGVPRNGVTRFRARFALPIWGKHDPRPTRPRNLGILPPTRILFDPKSIAYGQQRADGCRVNAAKVDSNVEVWAVLAIEHLWLGFLEL